ncbi:5'-nucleotidase [Chitinophaga silvatica]|uniref:5'-nucleotidase n=1 Tax=Chitinophaga silvatica TaxID=2282649 RepID=A0A3E1Y657_9BACT|nr:5'-nucleotidase [Chitinophaga silvatica]RFS20027.1 5'-nucleotidase [Chitinophaga silvatica]
MPLDLSQILVIGVSSRSLFNLETENQIFDEQGIKGYCKFQLEHENDLLEPGTAFHLVQSLLHLNQDAKKRIVEVVVMSRNSPETGVRIMNSVRRHDLDITRMAFSGGEPLAPYIDAFDIDLFLSKDEKDVQTVIDSKECAAAFIYAPPTSFNPTDNRVKIAFDADAVLFSDESEHRYKTEGMDAFHKYEQEHEDEPLNEGPFAKLLIKLSKIQEELPTSIELSPLRLAIVTARNAPSHMRVIKTLRKWGVYVDEAYFLGGLSKDKVLKAFGAHIFFDDQEVHLKQTSLVVPSGQVPYSSDSPLKRLPIESSALAKLEVVSNIEKKEYPGTI